MKIVVIGNEGLNQELLARGTAPGIEMQFVNDIQTLQPADAVIDLLFDASPNRAAQLEKWRPAMIFVNAVNILLANLPGGFVRFNGWPTLLAGPLLEASALEKDRPQAELILHNLNKKIEWLPDIAGFVTPRVISMIVNEAYFALGEEVSERGEIDTAMKLGTNYPFGPFEWASSIGLKNIHSLLLHLSQTNPRYEPASLLTKEALLS